MTTGQNHQNDSFSGEMRSLNLDVPDFSGDFLSMNYQQLANAKELVETSVDRLSSLLHETYKFDMSLPLVIDGFPRSDIDVVTVRLIRSKIVRLRNDHAAILDQLQNKLTQQFHSKIESSNVSQEQGTSKGFKNPNLHAQAFALVKDVVQNSPAEKAGLSIGDRITYFDGDINARNHNNLSALALRVKEKKDKNVPVEVLRDSSPKTLQLVPTENWPGRGLLGCHIVPI